MPSGGGVDLGRFAGGVLSGRTWDLDGGLHGAGLGLRWHVGSGWHAATEVGIDPFRDPEEGAVNVLVGLGRRL